MTTLFESINEFLNALLPTTVDPYFEQFNIYLAYYITLILLFGIVLLPLFKIIKRVIK